MLPPQLTKRPSQDSHALPLEQDPSSCKMASAGAASSVRFLLSNPSLTGFANPTSALVQTVRELTENALDASPTSVLVTISHYGGTVAPSLDEGDQADISSSLPATESLQPLPLEEASSSTPEPLGKTKSSKRRRRDVVVSAAPIPWTVAVEDDGHGINLENAAALLGEVFGSTKSAASGILPEAIARAHVPVGRYGVGLKAAVLYAQTHRVRPKASDASLSTPLHSAPLFVTTLERCSGPGTGAASFRLGIRTDGEGGVRIVDTQSVALDEGGGEGGDGEGGTAVQLSLLGDMGGAAAILVSYTERLRIHPPPFTSLCLQMQGAAEHLLLAGSLSVKGRRGPKQVAPAPLPGDNNVVVDVPSRAQVAAVAAEAVGVDPDSPEEDADMPTEHLQQAERDALLVYLQSLFGVPANCVAEATAELPCGPPQLSATPLAGRPGLRATVTAVMTPVVMLPHRGGDDADGAAAEDAELELCDSAAGASPHDYLVAARRRANASGVVHLLRFGCGTPLLSHGSACAITEGACRLVDWSNLGISIAPFATAAASTTADGSLSQKARRLLASAPATAAAYDTTDADLDSAFLALSAVGDDPCVPFTNLRLIVDLQAVPGDAPCCDDEARPCDSTEGGSRGREEAAAMPNPYSVIHRCGRVAFGDLAKTHLSVSDPGYAAVVAEATQGALSALAAGMPGVFCSASARRDDLLFNTFIPTIAAELAAIVSLAPAATGSSACFRERALALMGATNPEELEARVTERLLSFTHGTIAMHARAASASAAALEAALVCDKDALAASPVISKQARQRATKAAPLAPQTLAGARSSRATVPEASATADDEDDETPGVAGSSVFSDARAQFTDQSQLSLVQAGREAARAEWRAAVESQKAHGRARVDRKAQLLDERRGLWQPCGAAAVLPARYAAEHPYPPRPPAGSVASDNLWHEVCLDGDDLGDGDVSIPHREWGGSMGTQGGRGVGRSEGQGAWMAADPPGNFFPQLGSSQCPFEDIGGPEWEAEDDGYSYQ